MKRNRIFLIIFLLSTLCGCGFVKQKNGLTLQGNCYDNISEFLNYSEADDISELSQAYLKNVSYKITNLDEGEMMATIDIMIPNVTDTLSEIIDSIMKDDEQEESYIELRDKVKDEFIEKLLNGEFELESSTIKVPVEDVGGVYKIVSTDEMTELIYKDIITAYIEVISDIGGEN